MPDSSRRSRRSRSRSRSPGRGYGDRSHRPRRGSDPESYRRRRSRSRERPPRYDDRGPSRYGRSPPRRRGSRSRSPPRRAFGRVGVFSAAAPPSTTASFTLIARQLPPAASEESVRAAFGAYGEVATVRLITDAASGRCLGVGYVEMANEGAFTAALAARTLVFEGGLPVLISAGTVQQPPPPPPAQAAAPPVAPAAAAALAAPSGGVEAAAWGGQPEITAVLNAQVAAAVAAATAKLTTMQQLQRQPPLPPPPPLPRNAAAAAASLSFAVAAAVAASLSAGFPSSLPAPPPPPSGAALPAHHEPVQKDDTTLDEENGGGAARLGVSGRTALMSKLALTANLQLPSHTLRATAAAVPSLNCDEVQSLQMQGGRGAESLSRCLLLKGMFDRLSDEAQAATFYAELEADVRAECAALATGAVLHVAADKWSNGFIYVKFEMMRDAVSALARLDGRFFAKQRIRAEHVAELDYDRKWPKAKQVAVPTAPPAAT